MKIYTIILIMSMGSNLSAMQQAVSRDIQDGWSPLHVAAARNDKAAIEQLLAQRSRIDGEDKKGRTPLFIAAEFGSLDAVRVLSERGADLNAKEDEHGLTPLHVAAWKGQDTLVALLLEKGAKTEVTDMHGKTALHIAENKEVVRLLLARKANALAKDSSGLIPVDAAAKSGKREVVKALLAEVPELVQPAEDGTTLMHRMAQAGANADILKVIRAHGGDIWVRDKNKMIPFHKAVFAGRLETARALLALDPAQIKAVDKDDETPLHWSAITGQAEIAQLLLENKADIDARDKQGLTPLHWAAEKGKIAVAQLLIAQNANVNAQGRLDETPLHRAAAAGFVPMVALLLQSNANPLLRDSNQQTAYELALKAGKKEVSTYLAEKTGVSEKSRTVSPVLAKKEANAASVKQLQQVSAKQVFVKQAAGVCKPTKVLPNGKKETKLHKALKKALATNMSQKDQDKIAKLIAEMAKKKKSLDDLDPDGHSALMLTCGALVSGYTGSLEGVESHKITKRVIKKRTFTHHIACVSVNLTLAKNLLDAGADPSVANDKGITALLLLSWLANAYGATLWLDGENFDTALECFSVEWEDRYPGREKPQQINPIQRVVHYPTYHPRCGNVQFEIRKIRDGGELQQLFPERLAFIELPSNARHMSQSHFGFHEFFKQRDQDGPIIKEKKLLYELVREMVKKSVDVNHADAAGITTLQWALRGEDVEIVQILLQAGAQPDAISDSMKNELLVRTRNCEILKLLLSMNADVNNLTEDAQNILMKAAFNGYEDIVLFVLPLIKDVNHLSRTGDTALSLACQATPVKVNIIKALIEAGADKTKVLPSAYVGLSSDAKYTFDNTQSKKHPTPGAVAYGPPQAQGYAPHPYARFEAEERHRQQQANFESTEALKGAQVDAQNRATTVQAAGTALNAGKFLYNVAGGF